jgi:hypothetical protein
MLKVLGSIPPKKNPYYQIYITKLVWNLSASHVVQSTIVFNSLNNILNNQILWNLLLKGIQIFTIIWINYFVANLLISKLAGMSLYDDVQIFGRIPGNR